MRNKAELARRANRPEKPMIAQASTCKLALAALSTFKDQARYGAVKRVLERREVSVISTFAGLRLSDAA